MPLPHGTFTGSKWLAFFAELSAKITHHNVLVSIEGCETLKRILLTDVSIAAVLQEGDLLEALLTSFVAGIRSDRLFSASVALDEELSMTQLQTLSLCVDMMGALLAEGDAYYTLLVLVRAGVLVQGLLEVLRKGHPHFSGLVAPMLQTLLSFPLGRDPSPEVMRELAERVVLSKLPATAASADMVGPSVALRKHVEELADLVSGHGALLQDTADTLTAVVATTSGAPRFAALKLLNMTYKRLRKHHLRQEKARKEAGHTEAARVYASTRRGAAGATMNDTTATTATGLPGREATAGGNDTTLYAEHNVTITGAPSPATASGAADKSPEETGATEVGVDDDTKSAEPSAVESVGAAAHRTEGTGNAPLDVTAVQDISDLVDREAAEVKYAVPTELLLSVLASAAQCKSHEDFFASLNDLWSLTVADGKAVAAVLGVEAFRPFQRFLGVPPATRQDRLLFTELLLWLGHLMAHQMLLAPTLTALLDAVGSAFLPMLQTDLRARDTEGHTHHYGESTLSNAAEGEESRQTSFISLPSGSRLAGKRALPSSSSSSLADPPSISLALLSFLLSAERACAPPQLARWVQTGGLLSLVAQVIFRVAGVKSALIDTPTTADGALSEEVYLSSALRAARTNDVALATIGCKLLASLLTEHATALAQLAREETAALLQEMVPCLAKIAIQNPTVTSSATHGVSTSPLYLCPSGRGGVVVNSVTPSSSTGGARASRYTPLGECAVIALDACLAFNRSARLRCLSVQDILPRLPNLFRCTRHSIHAPLRGAMYRALTYVCGHVDVLSTVLEEMPSLVNTAMGTVLAYRADAPQLWEAAAAAAEWLCVVLRITTATPASTGYACSFPTMLHDSALTLRLLELIAEGGAPVNFATAALLDLCVALNESEDAHVDTGMSAAAAATNVAVRVLAPSGAQSLSQWVSIVTSVTVANEKLSKLARHPIWRQQDRDRTRTASPQGCHEAKPLSSHTATAASGDVALSSSSSRDAFPRALVASEHIAVQYAYTATTLRCLVALLSRQPTLREHLSHHTIYRLLGAALSVPCPSRVFDMLSARFSVPVNHHAALSRAYDALIQWACELAPVWFSVDAPTSVEDSTPDSLAAALRVHRAGAFPPMPTDVFDSAADVMSDETIPQRTRCHIPLFLSSLLILPVAPFPSSDAMATTTTRGASPSQECAGDISASFPQGMPPVRASMASASNRLFLASLALKRLTCVSGMQCRLVASFSPANTEAVSSGWFADRVEDLSHLSKLLVFNAGALGQADMESYRVTLSLVSSVLSHRDCPELSRELRQTACVALAEGVRFESTRLATIKALTATSRSREGRRCLLHEISTNGEPLARTCFGRVLALTLGIHTALGSDPKERSQSRRLRNGMTAGAAAAQTKASKQTPEQPVREAVRQAAVDAGFTLLTVACGVDSGTSSGAEHSDDGQTTDLRRPFYAAFVKYRGLDLVERLVCDHDRQRRKGQVHSHSGEEAGSIPLALLRLLATLSFDADVQKEIVQRSQLLAILVDVASCVSAPGSLALLVLRNVCFHHTLKSVLCQDMRVLLTLKAALMGLPSVEALVLDPELVFPTQHVVSTEATSAEAERRRRSVQRRNLSAALPSAWTVLRPEIVQSDNTALTDWATRATNSFYRSYIRSSSPSSSPSTAALSKKGGASAGFARAAQVSPRHHSPFATAVRTARAASPLSRRDAAVVTSRDLQSTRVQTNESASSRQAISSPVVEAVLVSDPPRLASACAEPVAGDMRHRAVADANVSAAETFRRQELAVSALWALMYNNQRGKVYVRRTLLQAPAIAVEKLFPTGSLDAAVGTDEDNPNDIDGRTANSGEHNSPRHPRYVETLDDEKKGTEINAHGEENIHVSATGNTGFAPSFWPDNATPPPSFTSVSPTRESGRRETSTPRASRLAEGVRNIQRIGQ